MEKKEESLVTTWLTKLGQMEAEFSKIRSVYHALQTYEFEIVEKGIQNNHSFDVYSVTNLVDKNQTSGLYYIRDALRAFLVETKESYGRDIFQLTSLAKEDRERLERALSNIGTMEGFVDGEVLLGAIHYILNILGRASHLYGMPIRKGIPRVGVV